MAWQKRGRNSYFYRSKKSNGQVTTHYLGRASEVRAHQAALEDQERHTTRTKERQEQQAWVALDNQITTLSTLVTALSHSTLACAGYYKHNRSHWRKRRNSIDRPEPLPTTS